MLRRLGALLPRCAAAAHSCAAETATCSSSAAGWQAGLLRAWQGPASYHSSSSTLHGGHSSDEDENVQKVTVTFVDKDGTEHKVLAPVGKHLLEVAHDNDIELEGACEASLACSTCHVIVEQLDLMLDKQHKAKQHETQQNGAEQGLTKRKGEDEAFYNQLPEATEDELDMLDLAFGLTDTSRLGCQVVVTPELDGLRVRIPSATRNFYVDGHVPKPH